MDYLSYITQFTVDGISANLAALRDKKKITSMYYGAIANMLDRVNRSLGGSKAKETLITRAVSLKLCRYLLVYELVRLDLQKWYFVKDVKNLRLSAKALVTNIMDLDVYMRSFPTAEIQRSVTTIMVLLAIEQDLLLHKKEGIKRLLALCADPNQSKLGHEFGEAQASFRANYQFNKKVLNSPYDVVSWLDPVLQSNANAGKVAN